jgi:DNA-directed RNA polymerase subunit RPC12/RpoP
MNQSIKYFLIGVAYFLLITYLNQYISQNSTYAYFLIPLLLAPIGVAIVVTIGILKTPKLGLIFGLSSIVSNIVWIFLSYNVYVYIDYFFYNYLSFFLEFILPSLFVGLFGYLPSKLFHKQLRYSGAIKGFITVLIISNLVNFFLYGTFSLFYSIFGQLIFGAISIGISCSRYIRINRNVQPQINNTAQVLCVNCGSYNQTFHQFCGRCGQPLNRNIQSQINNTAQVLCVNCGSYNQTSYKFCGKCGRPFNEDKTNIY